MRLVSIDTTLFDKYKNDPEVLTKSKRPYVLVIRLKYKERSYDFAVPIRSNIPAAAPKEQYFALPPRPTTRPKNRHGLHYIKMFPVTKQYLRRYRTEGNQFATLIQTIIDKNTKTIVVDPEVSYLRRNWKVPEIPQSMDPLLHFTPGCFKNSPGCFFHKTIFVCSPPTHFSILSNTISARNSIDSLEANATCGVNSVFFAFNKG